ncbi:Ankyrin repeats (3 copies) [Poriferisphaera corsica]|uniref:Ankyrin repeats (3 copies) n=1 Tax=Poriferisphaera corsica TaxID=2528020 RepID=A0A517YWK4_9BACT|nr:ankyrin repeat domain-containing protein [Poriferisphaera corsica]QDU34589.1 Ankyrin repeats (3 copies) [Poriferisphaera corsica]
MPKITRDIVGDFIDACELDHDKATRMVQDYPGIMYSTVFMSETPFHFLVTENFINAIRFLIEQGQDINALDEFKSTAFETAVQIDRYEISKLLLKHGADPNQPPSPTGEYPFAKAVMNKNDQIAKLLLEYGANIDLYDSWHILYSLDEQNRDYQPFCQAVNLLPENTDFVAYTKQLLDQPTIPIPKVFTFKTTLIYLTINNHFQAMKYLLQTEQHIYQSQADLDTALIYAAKNNHLNLARLLIDSGANPNACVVVFDHDLSFTYTQNCLNEALQTNHFEMFRFLRDSGANIEHSGDYGKQILPDLDQIIEDSRS